MTAKTASMKRTARTRPAAAKPTAFVAPRARRVVADRGDERFAEVVALIEAARARGYQTVNTVLVEHYRELGAYISRKIAGAEWGDGVVEDLAADLGQLSFYVEALDREAKKPHERPSIGVLLCATKDDEVVEYALARTTSPTLVAEYQMFLPSKAVLRAKLRGLYTQLAPQSETASVPARAFKKQRGGQ